MQHLYRHFDKDGTLLYVGVSINALNRLAQHKEASHWFIEITSVKIEQFQSREEVLRAEREAITNENPLHNLKRPKKREVVDAESTSAKGESRSDLIKRIVQFNPMYSLQEAAGVLNVGLTAIKRWIASGQLGYVIAGNRHRITGWQLIEFIEYLEKKGSVL